MRATLLKDTIKRLFPIKRTVSVEGSPGGGKTTIIQEVAKELGVGYIEKHMPTMLVEDFGILYPNGDDMLHYKLPDWFPAEGRTDIPDEGILYFDDRNQANNRTLDDLYLDFVNNVEPFITVISKDKKDASFIYTDRIVDSYSIDSNYYLSNKFKAYLSSANTMVGKNIDMLNLFEKSYNQILELANKA